ncbi:MAG: 16S rRNA (adenine(1518)-N(6)/adenine(1519)-N(6))-dimethyltransferase RsmA [Proteobacteria bacterium]|nr:16S rRNA (adenine(1518)-N(6)/adenine(1519)-N(6))-dimethyltransferase RsmA [Pseudomonadota bacterium]
MSSPSSFPRQRAKKRFGQNFLADSNYAAKIVDIAEIKTGDIVVEIGPGHGAITRLLAEKDCTVYALEIDRDLQKILGETFSGTENVRIIAGDALDFDFVSLGEELGRPLKIVANLPYNVATPILFRLLEARCVIENMVLMFQKEVALRIAAKPGNKQFGALSIFPQLYADIRSELLLPPGAFKPAPKVYSSVLSFTILKRPRFYVSDELMLKKVVSSAFSQRRKKLINSLKKIDDSADLSSIFKGVGIDPSRRAETLSVEEFCLLANAFF